MRSQLHAHIKRGVDSGRSNCCVTIKLCRQLYICILQLSPLQGSVWELKEERSSYKRLGGMRVEVKAGSPRLACWTPPTHVGREPLLASTSAYGLLTLPWGEAMWPVTGLARYKDSSSRKDRRARRCNPSGRKLA